MMMINSLIPLAVSEKVSHIFFNLKGEKHYRGGTYTVLCIYRRTYTHGRSGT